MDKFKINFFLVFLINISIAFGIENIETNNLVIKSNFSISSYFYFFIFLFLIFIIIYIFYFNKSSIKKIKNKISKPILVSKVKPKFKESIKDNLNPISFDNLKIIEDYEIFLDNLLDLTEVFKLLLIEEKELVFELKKEIKKLVKSGYSWTLMYYFLKKNLVSEKIIKQILDFNFILDKIEIFILKNKEKIFSISSLKKIILNQDFVVYFYFHNNYNKILDDIIILIDNSLFHGFDRDKFKNLFYDELNFGIENSKINFNFSELDSDLIFNLYFNFYDKLEKIESKTRILKIKINKSKISDENKNDLILLINKLEKEISSKFN